MYFCIGLTSFDSNPCSVQMGMQHRVSIDKQHCIAVMPRKMEPFRNADTDAKYCTEEHIVVMRSTKILIQ